MHGQVEAARTALHQIADLSDVDPRIGPSQAQGGRGQPALLFGPVAVLEPVAVSVRAWQAPRDRGKGLQRLVSLRQVLAFKPGVLGRVARAPFQIAHGGQPTQYGDKQHHLQQAKATLAGRPRTHRQPSAHHPPPTDWFTAWRTRS